MSKILILSLVFPPDSVSTAQIVGNLAQDFKSYGHTVNVLTTSPHYNRDLDAESRQPLRKFWGSALKLSDYHGIPVYHSAIPRKASNVIARLLGWIGFHLLSTFAGMILISRPDIIIAPSPPLTIGLSAWFLAKFFRVPYIYNVQEIYPDIAIKLGALKNPLLILFFRVVERFIYMKSAKVTVISSGMKKNLSAKCVPPEKIAVVPNFVDLREFWPLPKENSFSRRYGLDGKFVVSYAGNLGPAQGLDTIIEAARILRSEHAIQFLMMGDGMLRDRIRQWILDLGITNFLLLDYQPYSIIPMVYAASDINLVPQASQTGLEAIPSKVYRIMACARPVLAVTDTDSDLGTLVRSTGFGAVIPPGSATSLVQSILGAYRDQKSWQEKGLIGRRHVEVNYTREIVSARYNEIIRSAIS